MWRALLALPAIVIGIAVARAIGVSWIAFVPNLVGAGLGLAIFAFASRRESQEIDEARLWRAAFAVASLLGLTLLGPHIEGVARWVPLGPLRLHVSSVASPIVLVLLSRVHGEHTWRALAVCCIVHTIHCVQPDAGQASAFAIACCVLFARMPVAPMAARVLAVLVSLVVMAVAWARPDPLAPVPHVERIVHLAFDVHPLVGAGAVAALGALLVPFRRTPALSAYFAIAMLVPFAGAFPVPMMGAGAGPVLGWYAALALAATGRFGVEVRVRE